MQRRAGTWTRRRLRIALGAWLGLLAAVALAATQGSQRLPGPGYVWMPELAPSGPVVIVVSLPEQMAFVYRNGVRVAVANVSTGRPGFDTPTGVFSILQKHREHFSNRYDNAPMPFMQRLSWDGVALHAGNVPEYAASHGCIRLPYAFAEKLFGLTSQGMTVVVADERTGGPSVAYPGLFAPVDARTGERPSWAEPATDVPYSWHPERSDSGPVTIVLSTRDREIVVMRNAIEIGRAPVGLEGGPYRGTQVYVLLEGVGAGMSRVLPDRPALRWMAVPLRDAGATSDLGASVDAGKLSIAPEFARDVYDVLVPGATMVVTDDALQSGSQDVPLLRADERAAGQHPAGQP